MLKTNIVYNEDCLTGMNKIPAGSIDLILCDLPYGTTQNKWDSVLDLKILYSQYTRIIKNNGAIVLFSAQPFTTKLVYAFFDIFRYDIIWNKINSVGYLNANKMPMRTHEIITVFYKKLPTYNPQKTYTGKKYNSSKRKQNGECASGSNYGYAKGLDNSEKNANYTYPISIVDFKKDASAFTVHPTQKPVALFEYLIKTYTNEGDVVLDNCIGGGTTAIAAINTKRQYVGFELEKEYFDITQKRILEITDPGLYELLY